MPVWELRFYDTNPDSPEAADAITAYIHHNPVKRDLVPHARDWPWSSYLSHQHLHLSGQQRHTLATPSVQFFAAPSRRVGFHRAKHDPGSHS